MTRIRHLFGSVAVAATIGTCIGVSGPALGQDAPSPAGSSMILPVPPSQFGGIIGRKASESTPDFPQAVVAPKGAPNVLLILTDDTGFGASSTFGGPIPTPNLERVHQAGVCYNQFHTTALCSPTRAALLTGRNHHSVGFGNISEFATGYPGYDSILPKSAGTIGNILVNSGYNTSWFGKEHLIPDWLESPDGPFDQWPSGLGFEYFYGFLGGDTDNWHPALFENNKPVLPPVGDPNYILIHDMADRAINWIRTQHAIAPDKPFLMYFAPGNGHAPHHASKDWIAKFKGKFDQGWDKQREITLANQKRLGIVPADTVLTPRPAEIPAWDSLSADQKMLYARMMEVYAAAVAQSDDEIGRIIDSLDESGQLDNTLIIYIEGDNGASAEGTLQGTTNEVGQLGQESLPFLVSMMDQLGSDRTYNHYPVGWAHAMDTPFQWTKQVASHFGGTQNGMCLSWPKRITARGEIRPQFHHVIDIMPTILEAAGVQAPVVLNGVTQQPIDGVSMAYTFDDAKAPTRHTSQYFGEAHALLERNYDNAFSPYFTGSRWALPAQSEYIKAAQNGYTEADEYPVDARGLVFTFAFFSPKTSGTGSFYLMDIRDKAGDPLDGSKTYRLTVPANVPVKQYWSATVYDRATHALVREQKTVSRSSQSPGLQTNTDGSVDLWFGPKAPTGKETNWVPTRPQGEFEVLFRFYGPTKPLFDKSWTLPDIEPITAE
jgi:arylsulfatase A-like enzyme